MSLARKSSLTPIPPPAGTRVQQSVAASAGRLDHEYIARLHLHLAGRAVFLRSPIGALDPVAPDRARLTACDTERRDAPVIRQHHRGHRLQEAHTALSPIATAVPASPAAAAAYAVLLEAHREAPFEHLGIGQA